MKNRIQQAGVLLLNYLFPSLRDAFFIGALFAVAAQGRMLLNADGDIGRHITIGNYITKRTGRSQPVIFFLIRRTANVPSLTNGWRNGPLADSMP